MPEIPIAVRALVAREVRVSLDLVTDNAELWADLGANQMDALCIAIAIEDELDVTLSDAELERFRTVGQLIGLVEAHLDAQRRKAA